MSPAIIAGKYRYRVVLRNPAADSSRDSFGGRKGVGSEVATLWMEKTDWTGSEINEAGRETASVITKFRTRYRSDIAPKMQIVHGADVYEILAVLDFDGHRRELVLECRRVIV